MRASFSVLQVLLYCFLLLPFAFRATFCLLVSLSLALYSPSLLVIRNERRPRQIGHDTTFASS